jgi:acid phosphatase
MLVLVGLVIVVSIGCLPSRTITPGPSNTPIIASATPLVTTAPITLPTPSAVASPASVTPPGRTTSLPNFSHIFIILLENEESSAIVGNPAAPYLNGLAAQYARVTNYYGISHPSLPNYLALIGGDTFGITSDCLDCFVSASSVVDQIEGSGRTWKAYMESMPQPCFLGNSGEYAQRHNPFIYFDNIRTNPDRCNRIVPLTQLDTDLRSGSLPDYVWITPNVCNDMHDCSVAVGDSWLKGWVPKILASSAWQAGGVLFITFDEGDTDRGCCTYAKGGQVDMLIIAPSVKRGFTSDVEYDHYSLLRTIEEAWGLPLIANANCDCSRSMADFFAAP